MISYSKFEVNDNGEEMVIIFTVLAFFLAITFHEFMHAWTANYLGDETAKRAGRVSLNPIAHIDPFGTVILPALLIISGSPFVFGYAKPVPINPNNFKNPRVGSAITGLAGPVGNLILATVFSLIYKFIGPFNPYVSTFAELVVAINLILMIFNLIPIPPLDGSRLLALVFPELENPKFELYGFIVLLAFLFFFNGFRLLTPIISFLSTQVFGVPIAL